MIRKKERNDISRRELKCQEKLNHKTTMKIINHKFSQVSFHGIKYQRMEWNEMK